MGDCKQSLFALYPNASGDRRHFTVSSLANAMGDADILLLAAWLTRWMMQTFYC